MLGFGAISSQPISAIAGASASRVITIDAYAGVEFLRNSFIDYPNLLSVVGGVLSPLGAPIEWDGVISVTTDAYAPVEWASSLANSAYSAVDYFAVFSASTPSPIEAALGLSASQNGPGEWQSTANAISYAPTEWGGVLSVTTDTKTPIEWTSTASAVASASIDFYAPYSYTVYSPIEYSSLLNAATYSTAEILRSNANDSTGAVSVAASLLYSGAVQNDWSAGLAANSASYADWGIGVVANTASALESLVGAGAAMAGPIEWTAITVVTSNTQTAIDFYSNAAYSSALNIDWAKSVIAQYPVAIDSNLSVKTDSTSQISYFSTLAANAGINVDYFIVFAYNSSIPTEWALPNLFQNGNNEIFLVDKRGSIFKLEGRSTVFNPDGRNTVWKPLFR